MKVVLAVAVSLFIVSTVPSFSQNRSQEDHTVQNPNQDWGFGFQFVGAIPFFSLDNESLRYQNAHKAVSFMLSTEVQYDASFGGVSLGPMVRVGTNSPAFGGNLAYHFRYVPDQVVVPLAGYSFETMQPKDERDWFTIHGPYVGAKLLLNSFEKPTAGMLYESSGIRRTYVVMEAHFPNEDWSARRDFNLTTYAGLRFDW